MPGFGRALLFLQGVWPWEPRLSRGGGDFVKDGGGSRGGVGRLRDGATDDEEICSGGDGGRGRGHALLVAGGGAGRTDAGDDQRDGGKRGADGGNFPGAEDQAVNAGLPGQGGKAIHLGCRRAGHADGAELFRVHAGEHCDGQKPRRAGEAGGGGRGGFQHGGAPGSVEGEQAGPGGRRGADGSGDGVGNVVQLEIEEDGKAAVGEGGDDGRAFGNEQLEADLEPAAGGAETVGEGESRGGVGYVERDDEAVLGWSGGVSHAGSPEGS